jgi:hypothetical protein
MMIKQKKIFILLIAITCQNIVCEEKTPINWYSIVGLGIAAYAVYQHFSSLKQKDPEIGKGFALAYGSRSSARYKAKSYRTEKPDLPLVSERVALLKDIKLAFRELEDGAPQLANFMKKQGSKEGINPSKLLTVFNNFFIWCPKQKNAERFLCKDVSKNECEKISAKLDMSSFSLIYERSKDRELKNRILEAYSLLANRTETSRIGDIAPIMHSIYLKSSRKPHARETIQESARD